MSAGDEVDIICDIHTFTQYRTSIRVTDTVSSHPAPSGLALLLSERIELFVRIPRGRNFCPDIVSLLSDIEEWGRKKSDGGRKREKERERGVGVSGRGVGERKLEMERAAEGVRQFSFEKVVDVGGSGRPETKYSKGVEEYSRGWGRGEGLLRAAHRVMEVSTICTTGPLAQNTHENRTHSWRGRGP